jgi:signal transduction histidine kinase
MESIGLLTAGIAHEVGNPLTSISSIVQVLERSSPDELTREKLELIKSQVSRITRIIRDLVDFSRRSSFETDPTDINGCVTEAVSIVRVSRKARSIAITAELAPDLPPLSIVPDQIQQVVINILMNAVDAVHEKYGDRAGAGSIVCRTELEDGHVRITVADNGPGIAEGALQKIFEPFFTTKKVGEGTGLGLWVSYGIVRSFRGELTAVSTPGAGTTFTIRLPLFSPKH